MNDYSILENLFKNEQDEIHLKTNKMKFILTYLKSQMS